MSQAHDFKRQLRDMAAASAQAADEILDEELQTLLSMTREQLDKLRPHITDEAVYDKLIGVVEEATRSNEAMAILKAKLLQGGSGILQMGKKAVQLFTGQ